MNRQTIVERALCVLVPLLGFALIYGLPMLGLKFAVDHGLYIASAATVVPFLRATPLERISEVLGYHEHDGRRCAYVPLEELDGAPEFEVCIWADELHVDTLPDVGTQITTVGAAYIAANLRLTLDRLEHGDGPEYELAFGTPDGCDDFPLIDPADIPSLIDALTELYRTYHAHLDREDSSV
ncbi:hypothetical protein RCF27_10215 [Rhodococcus pyridinivorans]|uniref:Uncharacterized protein n=1 Tax=Rhodococcus pyridinivorans TaxID=103816 RepID=A0A7M2XRZ1_9NOCA|nr:hypothetical protein [Rhodococcus pyridinivorans]QOW00615.1 hypothetical protein INP59_10020 [Rhodococcus pyridinivorans]WMM74619.1 hypothetical protein RCF27_10215 [Rhodococcus pyridinivorans]